MRVAAVAGASLLLALLARAIPSRGGGPARESRFPHAPHLSDDAVRAARETALALQSGRAVAGFAAVPGTADKDCRSCHDYATAGRGEAHLEGCNECHRSDRNLAVERAAGKPSARRPFPHRAHAVDGRLTCFACHGVLEEGAWIEFSVPPAVLGARGSGWAPGAPAARAGDPAGVLTCADCHAVHDPKGGLVPKLTGADGDGRSCAECHLRPGPVVPLAFRPGRAAGGARAFRHEDHLVPGGGEEPGARCASCHEGIPRSRSPFDYDPTKDTLPRCGACHFEGKGKRPLVGPGEGTRARVADFTKFPHDRHVEGMRCQTCHYPERDPLAKERGLFPGRAPSPEPAGRNALLAYGSCYPCHAKDPGPVEGHGVGAWACFRCHDGTKDAAGNLTLASAKVDRERIAKVGFRSMHHPGVASAGKPLADPTQPDPAGGGRLECRACHVGAVEAIPSRHAGKPFRHEPHLPEKPGNDDCLACHSSAASATTSRDLRRFDPHLAGPPAPVDGAAKAKGCLECHAGATADQLGLASEARSVREFDHKHHVSPDPLSVKDRGFRGYACAECHPPGGPTGSSIPADVLSCGRCHSHAASDPEKFRRTGPNRTAPGDTAKCAYCHDGTYGEKAGGIERPPEKAVARTLARLLDGKQWHDRGGGCAACHERDVPPPPGPVYAARVRKAETVVRVHEDPQHADAWFNRLGTQWPGVDREGTGHSCLECHRREREAPGRVGGGRRPQGR